MKMQTNLAALVLLLSLQARSQDYLPAAKWQPAPVTADGILSEWQPFNFYDGATGLKFAIANNKDFLFLAFACNDEAKAIRLFAAGWQAELISKEKNKKFDASIAFPAIPPVEPAAKTTATENWKRQRSAGFETMTNVYKLQFNSIKTSGFKTQNGLLPLVSKDGINAGTSPDSLLGVVYELVIPLKKLYGDQVPQPDEKIMLHVTVNAMKMPEGDNNFQSGRRGGGRGMGMAGGRNRAASQGDQTPHGNTHYAERAALFEKASFKQEFRLSSGSK